MQSSSRETISPQKECRKKPIIGNKTFYRKHLLRARWSID